MDKLEIDPTKIISDSSILRSIATHKYEGALMYMMDNPEITSVVAYKHHNEYHNTPIYQWVLYRVGNDVWERVIVDDVIRLQHPFKIGFFA